MKMFYLYVYVFMTRLKFEADVIKWFEDSLQNKFLCIASPSQLISIGQKYSLVWTLKEKNPMFQKV